jgi:regulator of sigma E protease
VILEIIITIFCLLALIVLHELGHFLVAKKFGIKVEEFGIGFPPKIWGRKFGETLFSINLLPLGAFVKLLGEEGEDEKDPQSFSQKPLYQRALVILAGVIAFWIVAVIILSFVAAVWGFPVALSDEEKAPNPKIQVVYVLPGSPAQKANLEPLSVIEKISSDVEEIYPTKVKEVQEFIKKNAGNYLTFEIRQKNKEAKKIRIKPNEEGLIGVSLVRFDFEKTPWYLAPLKGGQLTIKLTANILGILGDVLGKLFKGEKVANLDMRGPIGIGQLSVQTLALGPAYFLYFLALISIYLAIFNILPIPAVDGGRLLFLGIEKLRGKPLNPRLEQKINASFFVILLVFLILVTANDIIRILK